jgi:hypothetical protein
MWYHLSQMTECGKSLHRLIRHLSGAEEILLVYLFGSQADETPVFAGPASPIGLKIGNDWSSALPFQVRNGKVAMRLSAERGR